MCNMHQTFLHNHYIYQPICYQECHLISWQCMTRVDAQKRKMRNSIHCKDSFKAKQAPVKMPKISETRFLVHRRSFHSRINCVEVEIERLLVHTEISTKVLSQ